MLNLAGTILAFFISQFGYFLDDEIRLPTDNNKETVEERLFSCQPFIYRIAMWLLYFLIFACMINTSLGAIFFFCGFLMYVWTEKASDIGKALLSVVVLLAAPILLHMTVCVVILVRVFFAWTNIRFAGVTRDDEQLDSEMKDKVEAGVTTEDSLAP
jgi:ABC-type microcin C transport system permease subunit YejE